MQKPLISVITVTFNAGNQLERTILSVINQNFTNLEYIIIDGGSSDNTVNIIHKYEKFISSWVSEPDNGIYDAMNKGIKHATGNWLIFMNAGDIFYKNNTIQSLVPFLREDVKIVYGDLVKCYRNHKRKYRGLKNKELDAVDFLLNTIDHQTAFISSSLFKKYGFYSTDYRLASDWMFFLYTVGIYREPVRYINRTIAYFMMDGASTLHNDQYNKEKIQILENEFGTMLPYMQELAEYRQSYILRLFLKIRIFIKKRIGKEIQKLIHFRL